MNPVQIIHQATAEGVSLALSPAGTIKATGDRAAVDRWLAVIREHKEEIIEALKVSPGDTATTSFRWLVHYPGRVVEVSFTPEATHAEVMEWHPDAVAAESFTPTIRQPMAPMTADEETAIRAWLAKIGETDPPTIAQVLAQCLNDADAQDYFKRRARGLPC